MTQSRDNMIQRRRQSTALYGRPGHKADYGEVRKGKAGRGRRRQSSLQHSCLVPVPEQQPTNTCINRNCCNKHTAHDKEQKQTAFMTGQFKEWRDERMIDRAKKTMCIHNTTDTYSIKKTIL